MEDPEIFRQRLINDGIDEPEIHRILNGNFSTASKNLPEWSLRFRDILEFVGNERFENISDEIEAFGNNEVIDKLPFLHLLLPLLRRPTRIFSKE